MNEIYDLLREAGTWFLATCEDGQPHVRPFGNICLYRDRLYFRTWKTKAVSRQLHANPRFEICAMLGPDWLRVEGSAVLDDDREALLRMPEACPALGALCGPDDGSAEVWYLRHCTAARYSFTGPPVTWKF